MSIDMSQFYQVFFEEAAEHLANMESLLLELDVASPDPEQLNAIFRAAHSIKGSAGTFGFTDLAEVTHVLENLLDRIRKGELGLRPDMIDAFLDAGDVLKVLLAAHRGEGESDPQSVAAMCTRLSQLTTDAAQQEVAPAQSAAPVFEAGVAEEVGRKTVRFALAAGSADTAEVFENLLHELQALGPVEVIQRGDGPENEMWEVALPAAIPEDEVRAILEFVVRSDTLRVTAPGQSVSDTDGAYGFFDEDSSPQPASSSDDDAYGLFEPVSSEAPSADTIQAADDSASYGFFDSLPPVPEVAENPAPVVEPLPPVETKPASVTASAPSAVPTVKAPGGSGEATIRVGVEKVDQLINLVGELVITQAMLLQSAGNLDPVEFERLHNGLSQLERNTRDLQESVMSIRMMPISVVFSRFPRVVRDLSQKLGKQVELKMIGEHTELDKNLIERIADPLTHLVRNSLDHGIEMPEARAANGKQAKGTITLKAYHQSGNIVVEVGDDGAGLNRQKILAKARERGLAVHDQMTDADVWQLIFEPGFSTADQITEVSGRGVGMDVVKKNITAMGGRVDIESMTGIGTRMTVRLPLTLAILDGMSVAVGSDTYIIPLGYVVESLQATRSMIKSVSGVERLIQVRGEYLPVVAMYELFKVADAVTNLDQGIMVILEADGVKAALFVDALVGQHQVVIKSLEANYRKVGGISGATIMGDGHVALILDVAALVAMSRSVLPAAA